MNAIITKYIPATNRNGSRIKASAEGVKSVFIPFNYDLNAEENHAAAADKLCAKYLWDNKLVSGGLPDQTGYAFCFCLD